MQQNNKSYFGARVFSCACECVRAWFCLLFSSSYIVRKKKDEERKGEKGRGGEGGIGEISFCCFCRLRCIPGLFTVDFRRVWIRVISSAQGIQQYLFNQTQNHRYKLCLQYANAPDC